MLVLRLLVGIAHLQHSRTSARRADRHDQRDEAVHHPAVDAQLPLLEQGRRRVPGSRSTHAAQSGLRRAIPSTPSGSFMRRRASGTSRRSSHWRPRASVGLMSEANPVPRPVVVVTGANGLVGSRICSALARTRRHRACRRTSRRHAPPTCPASRRWWATSTTRPRQPTVVRGATAVVTTVHPMGSDRETQTRIAVQGTPVLARAARDAGVTTLVHVSTAAVYDRSPGVGRRGRGVAPGGRRRERLRRDEARDRRSTGRGRRDHPRAAPTTGHPRRW